MMFYYANLMFAMDTVSGVLTNQIIDEVVGGTLLLYPNQLAEIAKKHPLVVDNNDFVQDLKIASDIVLNYLNIQKGRILKEEMNVNLKDDLLNYFINRMNRNINCDPDLESIMAVCAFFGILQKELEDFGLRMFSRQRAIHELCKQYYKQSTKGCPGFQDVIIAKISLND